MNENENENESQKAEIKNWILDSNIELLNYLFITHNYMDINKPDKDGKIPLIYAIENHNEDLIKFFIDHGADLNKFQMKNANDIFQFVKNLIAINNLDLMKILIQTNLTQIKDVYNNNNNNELLIYAVSKGNLSIIQYLIENGLNANQTPLLFEAIKNNNMDLIKYFVESGANCNECLDAIRDLHPDNFYSIISYLIDHGLDVNKSNDNGETVLIFAINQYNNKAIDKIMESNVIIDDIKIDNNYDIFEKIIKLNRKELMKIIINNNFHLNDTECLPLSIAIKYSDNDTVNYLVEHGALINTKNNIRSIRNQKTPLYYAIEKGDVNLVKYLIDHGANIVDLNCCVDLYLFKKVIQSGNAYLFNLIKNGIYNTKYECLIYAIKYKFNIAITHLVEKRHFNVNEKDEFNRTALYFSILNGDENITRYLVNHGADINTYMKHSGTPLNNAIIYKYDKIAKLLIDEGADLNKRDGRRKSYSPLELSIRINKNIALYLMKKGAFVDYDICSHINKKYNYTRYLDTYNEIQNELEKYKN
eukprot:jgi/Orpsp1_1/1191200/evm.model.d7180000084087.1